MARRAGHDLNYLGETGILAQNTGAPERPQLPPVLAAVKAYATLGEIVGVMQEVHGLYEEPVVY